MDLPIKTYGIMQSKSIPQVQTFLAFWYLEDLSPAAKMALQVMSSLCPGGGEISSEMNQMLLDLLNVSQSTLYSIFRSLKSKKIVSVVRSKHEAYYTFNPIDIDSMVKSTLCYKKWWRHHLNVIHTPVIHANTEKHDDAMTQKMLADAQDIVKGQLTKLHKYNKAALDDYYKFYQEFINQLNTEHRTEFIEALHHLRFRDNGESLFKFISQIRELGNPHTGTPSLFLKALTDFKRDCKSGKIPSNAKVFVKRSTLLSYIKAAVSVSDFSDLLLGLNKEHKDMIMNSPGFANKVKLMLKAKKDPTYAYRKFIGYCVSIDNSPYLPQLYKEEDYYTNYLVYKDK